MLNVQGLSCRRGGEILFADVSFRLEPGELLHIVGVNGSGKTTLLQCLSGLRQHDGGTIDGLQPDSMHYLAHHNAVNGFLTPLEQLQHDATLFASRLAMSADEALAAVRLDKYKYLRCAQLSAGQNRRVALARLWLLKAECWLLDEPFTALDDAMCAALEEKLATFCSEGGIAVVSSHQPLSDAFVSRELVLGAG